MFGFELHAFSGTWTAIKQKAVGVLSINSNQHCTQKYLTVNKDGLEFFYRSSFQGDITWESFLFRTVKWKMLLQVRHIQVLICQLISASEVRRSIIPFLNSENCYAMIALITVGGMKHCGPVLCRVCVALVKQWLRPYAHAS